MTSFVNDLNKIKAEEPLKEKTMALVRTELAKSEYERMSSVRIEPVKKEKPFMKKFIGAISAVAACALLVICGAALYNTPLNYVSFDINPSVELGINAFDRVVSTKAFNEDGEQLLAGLNVVHLSLKDAISDLVEQADEQGYLMDDGSSVIAITAESNNEQTAAQIQNTCENTIMLTLNKGETNATVYTDAISLQFAQQAKNSGVSPGKYKLIQVLQSLDPTVTVDQYKNAKISEIIAAANALIDQNGAQPGNNGNGNGQGNSSNADALQRIRNAALKAQGLTGNDDDVTIGQSGSVTIGQSGNGETEQNQNQNANQNKNKNSSAASQQEKEQAKEQEKNGNSTTASPATPANNGNGNGNGNAGSASGSNECSSSCPSDGTGAQSGSVSGNPGSTNGNSGKG